MVSRRDCLACFDALYQARGNPSAAVREVPAETARMFVEWRLDGVVAGNAGSITPLPRQVNLSRLALVAGAGIAREDIKWGLSCIVQFAAAPTLCDDPYDWEPGQHGIVVSGAIDYASAVFLPEVVVEQDMTKHETIMELIRRAGIPTEDPIVVQRFTTDVARATYEEWLRL